MPWVPYYQNTTGTNIQWTNIINNVTTGTTGTNYYPTWVNQTTAATNTLIYPQTARQWMWYNDVSNVPLRAHSWDEIPSEIVRSPARVFARPQEHSAVDKARELLLSHLNEEQRSHYTEHNWFIVIGSRSRRRYRIAIHHLVANVLRLDDGERLCAHCNDNLPISDHLLAQKLMIENDEDAFLAIANRHP
jgi:hypothetical protein